MSWTREVHVLTQLGSVVQQNVDIKCKAEESYCDMIWMQDVRKY